MLEKYCKGYWLSQKNLTLPPKDVRTMLEYVRKMCGTETLLIQIKTGAYSIYLQ